MLQFVPSFQFPRLTNDKTKGQEENLQPFHLTERALWTACDWSTGRLYMELLGFK